jgi:hypothetical protein
MRTFLMMKFYAVVAIAILGVRIAFYFLTLWELVQFFGSVIIISVLATLLHKYFEHRAHKTGKNAAMHPSFLWSMIVITILASGGVHILITYLSTGTFDIGFDIFFTALFVPAVVLFANWMYFQIQEQEYNKRLSALKEKE